MYKSTLILFGFNLSSPHHEKIVKKQNMRTWQCMEYVFVVSSMFRWQSSRPVEIFTMILLLFDVGN